MDCDGVGGKEDFCVGVGGQEDRQNEGPGGANGMSGGLREELKYQDGRKGRIIKEGER